MVFALMFNVRATKLALQHHVILLIPLVLHGSIFKLMQLTQRR